MIEDFIGVTVHSDDFSCLMGVLIFSPSSFIVLDWDNVTREKKPETWTQPVLPTPRNEQRMCDHGDQKF